VRDSGQAGRLEPASAVPTYDGTAPTRLQVVFDWIEDKSSRAAGIRRQPFKFKAYENALAQIALIVDPARNGGALTTDCCVCTNIQLLRWLSITYPIACRRLALDGMLIKAWVPQRGTQADWDKENRIRGKFAPKASARLIKGKRGSLGRFVRGYYLFALTDLATNLPVTWGLWPAGETNYELQALRFLLNDLFEQWPECPTTQIVADRAWDLTEAIRDSALRFGIHLIVGRDDERADEEDSETRGAPNSAVGANRRKGKQSGKGDEPTRRIRVPLHRADYPDIAAYDRYGSAYCRHCLDENGSELVLTRKTYEFFGRKKRNDAGMTPGEAAKEGSGFRVFYSCPRADCPGAKKRGLHMSLDWAALSAYPHTFDGGGRGDLHAERLALYGRRNSCEALFAALKLGHKLGLDGSDRTHTPNEHTVETLLSLALVLRTAFVTAHERAAQQVGPVTPPPELLQALVTAR
jgi:hypothetical protein